MSDLISRQAAVALILSGKVGDDSPVECPEECNSFLEWAAEEIGKMPSAQAGIIRCKDCKWYTVNELKKDGTDDRRYKPSYCLLYSMRRDADWFCADGERSEDDSGV